VKPDPRFVEQPRAFWANVRSISQQLGYTQRGTGRIKIPALAEIRAALRAIGLHDQHVVGARGRARALGRRLIDYFAYRAAMLNGFVEPRLLDASQAGKLFRQLHKKLRPSCPIPMNKQKGRKRAPA